MMHPTRRTTNASSEAIRFRTGGLPTPEQRVRGLLMCRSWSPEVRHLTILNLLADPATRDITAELTNIKL